MERENRVLIFFNMLCAVIIVVPKIISCKDKEIKFVDLTSLFCFIIRGVIYFEVIDDESRIGCVPQSARVSCEKQGVESC